MILLRWFITTLSIFALPFFVSGISLNGANTILTAIIVGACLVFLDMVVKPIVSILTLPLNMITLGLFSMVINAGFFWFIGQIIVGFVVANFNAAIIGAFVISVINWIVSHFVRNND